MDFELASGRVLPSIRSYRIAGHLWIGLPHSACFHHRQQAWSATAVAVSSLLTSEPFRLKDQAVPAVTFELNPVGMVRCRVTPTDEQLGAVLAGIKSRPPRLPS